MTHITNNASSSESPRIGVINSLFLKYKACRNEHTKRELCAAVVNTYTPEFIKAKRPDWSDFWREEVYTRLHVKFMNALNDPECVKKGKDGKYKLTAYMSSAFYSVAADVFRHYSKESDVVQTAWQTALVGKNAQEAKFAKIVWDTAMNLSGVRGEIFRRFLLGLEYRSEQGGANTEYTIQGIATRLNLTTSCVTSHIGRGKRELEHKLRPLGVKMGALSQQVNLR